MFGVDGASAAVELMVLDDVRVGHSVPVVGDDWEPPDWEASRNV
jgi:hypothetical protein